ncbi:hypothetical protein BKA64DRAFT_687513 [Cadophora sp. MPI-SDFR-AT-0126]|nr:hypothetical protein BKA64DRAFT_687513 [Leotiomycetes sp. MPI-SDFR-AT-0126]
MVLRSLDGNSVALLPLWVLCSSRAAAAFLRCSRALLPPCRGAVEMTNLLVFCLDAFLAYSLEEMYKVAVRKLIGQVQVEQ